MARQTSALVERVCRHGHVGQYELRSGVARCGECRRGEAHRYREQNLEAERARVREYMRANPEKAHKWSIGRDPAVGRAYREANPEKIAALQHAWYVANKFVVTQRTRLRRAKYELGDLTQQQWNDIVAACEGRCLACGRDDRALTVDHVTPLCKGGEHTAQNVQPLCDTCNKRKFTKVIDYRLMAA
jgi:5-methylcytosine-specific restriction endonuclease McrA